MASLPDEPTGQPTAADIANQFVQAYYKTETDQLHEFYNQDSVLARVDPGLTPEENANVVGLANITKKLQEQGSKKFRVALEGIESQETVGGGVVIVLTGILTSAGTHVRVFSQTLVLAQETSGGQPRYYVRNDSLRYFSKSILSSGDVPKTPVAASGTQTPVSAGKDATTSTSSGTDTTEEKPELSVEPEAKEPKVEATTEVATEAIAEATTETATETPKAEDAVAVRKEKKPRTRKAKKAKEEKVVETTTETKTEAPPAGEPEKTAEAPPADDENVTMPAGAPAAPPVQNSSWAGRLFFKSAAPLPLLPPIPDPEETKNKKSKAPKAKGPKTSNKKPNDEGKLNGKPDRKENGHHDRHDIDVCSIYIANLNKPIKKEEVRKLFEPFGIVEDVHPVLGKNFCFVRFNSADSVEKILKTASKTPFVLNDATLAVSPKKTIRDRPQHNNATRGGFRGGRGGGRGGSTYQNKTNGASKDSKAADNNDGFTEATRRGNRHKRPQNS